jgi:hypothetical protein
MELIGTEATGFTGLMQRAMKAVDLSIDGVLSESTLVDFLRGVQVQFTILMKGKKEAVVSARCTQDIFGTITRTVETSHANLSADFHVIFPRCHIHQFDEIMLRSFAAQLCAKYRPHRAASALVEMQQGAVDIERLKQADAVYREKHDASVICERRLMQAQKAYADAWEKQSSVAKIDATGFKKQVDSAEKLHAESVVGVQACRRKVNALVADILAEEVKRGQTMTHHLFTDDDLKRVEAERGAALTARMLSEQSKADAMEQLQRAKRAFEEACKRCSRSEWEEKQLAERHARILKGVQEGKQLRAEEEAAKRRKTTHAEEEGV